MGEVDWEKLREPFPANQIGKIPKSGIEIDYVGHAWITARLNEFGGDWVMERVSEVSYPGDDLCWQEVCLTIGGVKRYEVGCADPRKQEYPKLLWSDCLTRAAMRHGIALALWQKETPDAPNRDRPTRAAQSPRAATSSSPAPTPALAPDPDLVALLELLQGDVDALDMASKEDWAAWKQGHVGWHKSMDTALDARNFVMRLLEGPLEPPDDGSGTLLG